MASPLRVALLLHVAIASALGRVSSLLKPVKALATPPLGRDSWLPLNKANLRAADRAAANTAALERLRSGYARDDIVKYGQSRPVAVSKRVLAFTQAAVRVSRVWESEGRGEALRREIAALGPVATKVGQTLSQRPDILPVDVCEELKTLQTANAPFDNQASRIRPSHKSSSSP